MLEVLERDADLSPDGRFRYSLYRKLAVEGGETITWVMLNPSTADASEDDPTVRRCMGFSAAWGFTHMYVVNVFAFRATSPDDMRAAIDPHGPDNGQWIRKRTHPSKVARVVFAWGVNAAHLGMAERMEKWIKGMRNNEACYTLGRTKAGFPKHPLFLAKTTELQDA